MPRLPFVPGILLQRLAAGVGEVRRRGVDGGAPGLHEQAAIGLLLVADLHHVDRALHAIETAGEGERAAPLAGAGLGGDALDARELVVVGLRDGGVRLVAAGRAEAFVLVVDAGGSAERLLQPMGAEERAGAPEPVDVLHVVRDLHPRLHRHFLLDQLHGEDRGQGLRADRLAGSGMKRGGQRRGQIGLDVVPALGHLTFAKQNLRLVTRHGRSSY